MAGNSEAYEARLDHADSLHGTHLPEREDAQLEKIARLIVSYREINADEIWRQKWDWETDAYANAMSGGSSLLRTAKQIRAICAGR